MWHVKPSITDIPRRITPVATTREIHKVAYAQRRRIAQMFMDDLAKAIEAGGFPRPSPAALGVLALDLGLVERVQGRFGGFVASPTAMGVPPSPVIIPAVRPDGKKRPGPKLGSKRK